MKKSAILILAIRQLMSASHTILYIYRIGIYSARPETWNFDRAKAPGFADRKRAHIANIALFTIDEPRELSRRSKSKFQAARSISYSCV